MDITSYCTLKKYTIRAEQSALDVSIDGPLEAFGEAMLFVVHNCSKAQIECFKRGQRAFWTFRKGQSPHAPAPIYDGGDIEISLDDVSVRLQFPTPRSISIMIKMGKGIPYDKDLSIVFIDEAGELIVRLPFIARRLLETVSNILCIYNPLAAPAGIGKYGGRVIATKCPYIVFQQFAMPVDAYIACCKMQVELFRLKSVKQPDNTHTGMSCQRPRLMTIATAKTLLAEPAMLGVRPLFPGLELRDLSKEDVHAFMNLFNGVVKA